ncbi:MAG TPA: GTPase Era [Labilithrix sp.]|nr:GTPase Era [Labilithrix sp.]
MHPRASKKKPARPALPEVSTRAGTIALVGRPNVGKSTLLNALLEERIAIVSHHAQTTRDRIAGILTRDGVQYVFLDTPGFHRARHKLGEHMNEVARAAAAECDVALFLTEPETRAGKDGVEVSPLVREDDRAILKAIPEGTAIVLVLNKIDKIKRKQVLMPLLENLGKERDLAAIVPVSALKGEGLDRILAEVAKLLPESEPLYEEDELSDKPVRFFVGEFVREQILRRTRQEIPHGVAVTVESFDENAKLVRIAVTIHVAKESHKGIIIGDGGKMLSAVGTAARKRAEELLGRKVHLETFVRATPGWFDDAARLADMGYMDEAGTRKKRAGRPRSRPTKPRTKDLA